MIRGSRILGLGSNKILSNLRLSHGSLNTAPLSDILQVGEAVSPHPFRRIHEGAIEITNTFRESGTYCTDKTLSEDSCSTLFLKLNENSNGANNPEPIGFVSCLADGIGFWRGFGIDPRQFSREIVKRSAEFAKLNPIQALNSPLNIISSANESMTSRGSSTLTVLSIDFSSLVLRIAHIGDCGVVVIRDSNIIYSTPAQMINYTTPYQLGHYPSIPNQFKFQSSTDAHQAQLQLKSRDVVILASDGLFHNVFQKEICSMVSESSSSSEGVANVLVDFARGVSLRSDVITPFYMECFDNNRICSSGGVPDDITAIVIKVA